jgi:hypothetical protein
MSAGHTLLITRVKGSVITVEHPLWHQLLHTWKVAEMAGSAVLSRRQQAQGKHGNECRGMQPETVNSTDPALFSILSAAFRRPDGPDPFRHVDSKAPPVAFRLYELSEWTRIQSRSVERWLPSAPLP